MTGRGQALTVGAVRNVMDFTFVPRQGGEFLAGLRVPQLHRLVVAAAAAGDATAIGPLASRPKATLKPALLPRVEPCRPSSG